MNITIQDKKKKAIEILQRIEIYLPFFYFIFVISAKNLSTNLYTLE